MDNQLIVVSLCGSLGLFAIYRFALALWKRKITNKAAALAWGIFFLVCLIAVLTLDSVVAWIDGHFGGLPVTTLVRILVMFVAVEIYSLATERVYPERPRVAAHLIRLTAADSGLCIGIFVWFALQHPMSTAAVMDLMMDFRDVMLVAWTLFIFIPFSLHLWRNEEVRLMKMHRLVDITFWTTFLIECMSGILLSLTIVFPAAWVPYIQFLDHLSTDLCYLLALLMLVPYRWVMLLFYPGKLVMYFQLKRLQNHVQRWASTQLTSPSLSLNLTHPGEIDLAIYQTTIAILDIYPSISGSGHLLREQIQQIVETRPDYQELVERVASIRV